MRIGVDQAFGGWNAPVDPETGDFVYVPIPENATTFHTNCDRRFRELIPALKAFCDARRIDLNADLRFDNNTLDHPMHLDPDFECLTYGDDGARRGAGIATMTNGDVLVFYAGLRPVTECGHKLVYALVGKYVIDEVLKVTHVAQDRWHENAHSRKTKHAADDIVVRARRGASGRLERCVPIGEWRDGAYRVKRNVLDSWGGLSVKDGFIQRSAVPPSFLNPELFSEWMKHQNVRLLERNN